MAEKKDTYALRYVMSCRNEAGDAKFSRMALNRDNFSMYQLEHDFSHKQKGQSMEILAKTRNATEQIKSFFQQALADLGDWYRITATDGTDGAVMAIKPEEMYKLLNFMLGKADYFSHVGNSVQSGLLGSLSISEVGGELISKPKFKTRKEGKGKSYKKHVVMTEDKTWELRFQNIRQEDYYPDPTGGRVYEVKDSVVDLHVVKALAKGDDAIYEADAVADLKAWGNTDMQDERKSRETGQNTPTQGMRPRVKITDFIGAIVAEDGEILHENVIMTIANDDHVIRKPTPNTLWHQRSPIVAAALIEVAHSVWGIAMMDAGTKHNRSLIEVFNLILDSAMKSVWGINQIRTDMLEDPTQITDGIRWGTNLKTSSTLPHGAKVMEEVVSGRVPPEALTVFNLLTQETLTSMMTNDMRMGAQSMRAVKATEVVAAENSITSVFQGMAKNFEEKKIQPELELACWTVCQNWDLIDKEIFKSLFGAERGEELSQMEPQDVFVATVNGMKFEVFGISITLRRQADFRKWTTLLQTIGASEVLIEAFLAQYTFEGMLGEIMTALGIDKSKIRKQEEAAVSAALEQPGGAPGAMPDMASQQMSATNVPTDPLAAAFMGNQMSMPDSQRLA